MDNNNTQKIIDDFNKAYNVVAKHLNMPIENIQGLPLVTEPQELYIQISNKLENLFFEMERVDTKELYQTEAYYEDVLRSFSELEDLEKNNQNEWDDSLQRVIRMKLDVAIVNVNPEENNKYRDIALNTAIYALRFCKDKEVLKNEYNLRLQKLAEEDY